MPRLSRQYGRPILDSNLERLTAACAAYTSDSRDARSGDLFVALRGSARDGHDFVPGLVASGVCCIIERGAAARLGLDAALVSGQVLEVEDTHAAHREIAGLFRRRFRGPVVGIGGSSGKTTAKEFTAALLAARFRVAKTQASQNGELGIPKTMEQLRPRIDLAVIEIGIDAPGDMVRHAALVAPDIAVLTSIGEEHLNLLGSIEGVFREEVVLFDRVRERGGVCFAPADDPWLARLKGQSGVSMVPSDPRDIHSELDPPLRNPYVRRNAALACAVAVHLGLRPDEIAGVLEALAPPKGRGGEYRLDGGTILLLDHYNANPSSMRAGLAAAQACAREAGLPLHLVLGDMLDLGARTRALHEALVPDLQQSGAQRLWLVGEEMSRLASHLAEPESGLRTFADSGVAAAEADALGSPAAVVLFKGSRGMALERVIDRLAPGRA
jgi:UDP-N-acetylmuramoyl-tripeptide--D-alanyl-D-alanine ligase